MEYVSRNPKSTVQPLQGTGVWDGGSQTPKTPCHVQPGGHNQTPPRQTQSDQLQRIRTNWTVQMKKKLKERFHCIFSSIIITWQYPFQQQKRYSSCYSNN